MTKNDKNSEEKWKMTNKYSILYYSKSKQNHTIPNAAETISSIMNR